jgi:tRNA A37 threonylcarbamoyltransferase TsaD
MWNDENPEKKFLALLLIHVKNLTMTGVKRDYRKFYVEILASFEKLKKNPEETKCTNITLPQKLVTIHRSRSQQSSSGIVDPTLKNTLSIESKVVKEIFENIFKRIKLCLSATCTKDRMRGVQVVCLIGGYANNSRIRNIVREHFTDVNVILPQQPERVIVMGATLCSIQDTV